MRYSQEASISLGGVYYFDQVWFIKKPSSHF